MVGHREQAAIYRESGLAGLFEVIGLSMITHWY